MPRRPARIIALCACLLWLAALPARAETVPPSLVDLSFSSGAVTVSGTNYATITVSVRLTDTTGVVPASDMALVGYPLVQMQKTGTSQVETLESLMLTSGTARDGTWTEQWLVPSTFHGTWEISRVAAYDEDGNLLDVDPRDPPYHMTRTLAVTGTHRPHVTMGFSPQPVHGNETLTVKGRAYDTETGQGIANYKLWVGRDASCAEGYGDRYVFTNSQGYYSATWSPLQPWGHGMGHCVFMVNPPVNRFGSGRQESARIVARGGVPVQKYQMSVYLADATITLGQWVTFTGAVYPHRGGGLIHLQKWSGSSWVTIVSARIRESSRYTLQTKPATRGTRMYRVYLPGDRDSVGSVSKAFVVTIG